MLTVRPMIRADADEVLAIYQAGIDTGQATFETVAPAWAEFDSRRLPDHRFVAVAADKADDDRDTEWGTGRRTELGPERGGGLGAEPSGGLGTGPGAGLGTRPGPGRGSELSTDLGAERGGGLGAGLARGLGAERGGGLGAAGLGTGPGAGLGTPSGAEVSTGLGTGRVLGWVAVAAVSTRPAYAGVVEHGIYIAPAARGQGVGTALLQALIASTEAAGIWTIQSSVFPENTASIALHTKAGFRIVGTRERIARHHGRWRDTVLLERRTTLI